MSPNPSTPCLRYRRAFRRCPVRGQQPLTAADVPVGTRYGRMVTIGEPYIPEGRRESYVPAVCDCGNERTGRIRDLRNGRVVSCGCFAAEATANRERTHGYAAHPLYDIWCGIRQRTMYPHTPWADYGGRGISMYPGWRDSPEAFIRYVEAELGPGPGLGTP